MAAIPGSTPILGFVAPNDSEDTYPSHSEEYGKGGYRTVANIAARNAIPEGRRKAGMRVYVEDTGIEYTLGDDLGDGDWAVSNRGAQVVSTVAAFDSLAGANVPNGTEFYAKGFSSTGDGGEGPFYFDSSSSATAVAGIIAVPSDNTGRFIRKTSDRIINVKWTGAKGDGTTNDTTAIAAADTYAATFKGVVYFPAGTYMAQVAAKQFVTYVGASQPGAKNTGEGGTIIKLPSGTADGTCFKAQTECSVRNIQFDGNKTNVTGTSRGIWFDATGVFKESDIQNCTVVNCLSDGIYLDAHEIKLINVSALYNGGRGIYVGACYDIMLDHILCGWNDGNGFEAAASGATMRIQQLDSYYNKGSGAVFHSPFWTFVNRLQCDYNFKDGLEIDVSTTSTYIDIYYPLIYGSNVDQDNFGNTNSAASGTYSDVKISGTQYPKNVRIIGNKIGLSTASTKKPQYHINWTNSQPGVGFNCTFQDIDVDTSSGATTSTGKSTPDTFLASSSWSGRLFNHRDGTVVRTITRNAFYHHTTDGSTTPQFTIFNDYNVFLKNNLLASGYVSVNNAVYSGRGFTADKSGVQIKGDTSDAFGLSNNGNFFIIGSDVDSTPSLLMDGSTGESYFSTTLSKTSGTDNAFRVAYTINQATGTGSSRGLTIAATETAKGSGTHRLINATVGVNDRFYIQTDGRPVVISPNGTAGMLLRGDTATDSQISLNYAATLDRRLTLAGNSINCTDSTGSSANSLSLQTSGGALIVASSGTTQGIRLGSSSGPGIFWGSGTPEAAVTAPVGSTYHRTDGGAGTSYYVKESGSLATGWVAK